MTLAIFAVFYPYVDTNELHSSPTPSSVAAEATPQCIRLYRGVKIGTLESDDSVFCAPL
jgi:hypothetical protein